MLSWIQILSGVNKGWDSNQGCKGDLKSETKFQAQRIYNELSGVILDVKCKWVELFTISVRSLNLVSYNAWTSFLN